MCGIFLHIDRRRNPQELLGVYREMSGFLSHRGPDAMGVVPIGADARSPLRSRTNEKTSAHERYVVCEHGFFDDADGFMGHHRLSIIDLSASANQPLIGENGKVALVYNGEVYNYLELRRELQDCGHAFRTSSDSEVVLRAYVEWGKDCFRRLNGDFAILIYDARTYEIVGARDRLGVKPLFWMAGEQRITLCSEIKGFLAVPGFTPELNREIAYRYLVADFPTAESLQETFISGIRRIPAGHCFAVDLTSLSVSMWAYWSVPDGDAEAATNSLDVEAATEQFDSLLSDAVRIRLRSDVCLGSFLSGGMDSPSVVWHAKGVSDTVPTFSSVFPGSAVDESENIDMLVREWGIANHAREVVFDDFVRGIGNLVFLQDEPFSTLNVYTQYLNFQKASQFGVKVMLDGGGADEYLAGYADYRMAAAADSVSVPEPADPKRADIERFGNLTASELTAWFRDHQASERRVDYVSPDLRRLVRGNAGALDRPIDPNYKGLFRGSYLKNALLLSTTSAWMNKSVSWDNRYLDLTGMSLGIEARVPFQDHRLIEFVLSLPPSFIYRDGFSKFLLRRSMAGRMPDKILKSKNKVGYEFPLPELLRTDREFEGFFRGIATDRAFREWDLVDGRKVQREIDRIIAGKSTNYNIWRVFNLYLWCRDYIGEGRHMLAQAQRR